MTAHPERIEELEALVAYLQADCARTERNRDLWRSQCKHQAAALEAFRAETAQFKAQRDELLAALQVTTAWMERLRACGDAGNWEWSQGDEYSQGIAAIQKATNKEQA